MYNAEGRYCESDVIALVNYLYWPPDETGVCIAQVGIQRGYVQKHYTHTEHHK